ncbi:MAG: hypothetical protein L0G52_08460 [Brachybacterium sp.]|nr:hypothetical protein [Brachybacterium sp.]
MSRTPFTRRAALASGAALASTAVLASCGGDSDEVDTLEQIENPDENLTPEGMPIATEKITIDFLSARPSTTAEDWNEVSVIQATEELTNVHIDFGLVPQDGAAERRNLALSSGDYPSAFYRNGVGTGDLATYGERGTFIPLNDLLEQHMPNLTALMEESPQIREGLTFPDGNIYSTPQIYDPSFPGLRYMFKLFARQDWLDRFGMTVPETTEEFEAYLEESVNTIDGAIGLTDPVNLGETYPTLYGTFGVANQGTAAGQIDLDPDTGKVRYFPLSDGYREMMEYLHGLYSKGLIPADIFSSDRATFTAQGSDGLLAACATAAPAGYFGAEGENYVVVPPLVQNAGDTPVWHAVRSELASIGHFVMTDRCEHPVALARWMDYWYSEEGARQFFLGNEGDSWEEVDGEYQLLPEITEGQSVDDGLKPHSIFMGGSYPGWVTQRWFGGVESMPQAMETSEAMEPYAIPEVWSAFTFTPEESDVLGTVGAEIGKYLGEARAGFITGQTPLSEWDAFVQTLQDIGLDEFMEIQQAAYDRRQ